MSPMGDYSDALAKPESFPQDQRLVVRGVIVGPQAKPVQGVVVRLFPLDEEGPGLILGMVDGGFGIANPSATTDEAGRFALTTGPLWRFSKQVTLGLIHQRSPDRPFDVGVLPFTGADGMLKLALNGEQKEFDLGNVALAVAEPGKPAGGAPPATIALETALDDGKVKIKLTAQQGGAVLDMAVGNLTSEPLTVRVSEGMTDLGTMKIQSPDARELEIPPNGEATISLAQEPGWGMTSGSVTIYSRGRPK
jgi:hypothetical protein